VEIAARQAGIRAIVPQSQVWKVLTSIETAVRERISSINVERYSLSRDSLGVASSDVGKRTKKRNEGGTP
jgi:hypothetical protein